jgi:hypothetical protein
LCPQREDEVRHKKRAVYADEVRQQIREKEQLRISERNAFFEEGVKLDEEARRRRAELEAIKKKKLEELRYMPHSFLLLSFSLGWVRVGCCFVLLCFVLVSFVHNTCS